MRTSIVYRVYDSRNNKELVLTFSNLKSALIRAARDHESGNVIHRMVVNGIIRTRQDILQMCRQYKLL